MRPYIKGDIGNGKEFQITHVIIEPEIEPSGKTFYCLVGYDANHGLKVNLMGKRNLEEVIGYLVPMVRTLVRLREEAARNDWEKENEEENEEE